MFCLKSKEVVDFIVKALSSPEGHLLESKSYMQKLHIYVFYLREELKVVNM